MEATPKMPQDWNVHHTKQKCLEERYDKEKDGTNVHELKYLRGIPHELKTTH
jgi:hypothetical protein